MTHPPQSISLPDDNERAVRIIDLLRERERAFVSVWLCEKRVREIVRGADFPFPDPPDLPSTQRRKNTKTARPPDRDIKIRRLQDNEDAYRITCRLDQEEQTVVLDHRDTLRALADLQDPHLHLMRIDTVRIDPDLKPHTIECLWHHTP